MKQQSPMGICYEDFEPCCKWKRDQNHDTIEVHLAGFKRKQLNVELIWTGMLIITGERPLDGNKMKRSRFRKVFPVSKDFQPNQIQAKFSNGILYLVLPSSTNISGVSENMKASAGTNLISILKRNQRVALEIVVAIFLAVVVGAYVNKYFQCSHLGNS